MASLADTIRGKKPRPVKRLNLRGWATFGDSGEWFLRSPDGVKHVFLPDRLGGVCTLPVIVCRREGGTHIIDGIHRTVAALRAGGRYVRCVYVTAREMDSARLPNTYRVR